MSPRVSWILLPMLAVTGFSPAVLQVRDPAAPPTIATASIAGIVVDDEQPARPVRRAVVTLTGAGLHPNRGAITDDDGRFVLRGLPAGHFTLTAERGGFVTSIYGAKRPARPGTAIIVANGQQIADLRVRLWRGAVLSGTLRDESGAPLADTPVTAIPARDVTPAALTLSNSGQAMTNDLGEYRIFGLEPGTYVIRAGSPQMGTAEIAASEADIDAILAALAAHTRPGVSARTTDHVQTGMTVVSAAPIYFPGTAAAADATPITIQAGEEHRDLDFTVQRIRTATIRGRIVTPDGAAARQATVRLAAVANATATFAGVAPAPLTTTSGTDGAFALAPVSPGTYTLLARGTVAASLPNGAAGSLWWSVAPISVTGDDIDLAAVTLQPGMTFSGRVVLDAGATTPAPDLTQLRVQLHATSLADASSRGRGGVVEAQGVLQPAMVRADGTFEVSDLVPDDYHVTVSGDAIGDGHWWLRSALWNGRDLLDAPLQIAPREDVAGVALVLSDRHTELSGTLTMPGGAAAPGVFMLAFPADATLRVPDSRRIQAVRPDSGGRFVFTNLPPGDYFVAALTDVDDGEWNEPGVLDSLVASSIRITLADGEKKVQDFRVNGASGEQ